ncbi:hypothetical protein [Planococcus sp. CAU13]|uniref:hypothetical protein n=1 Tax=Planococcus sp. CAU13 TaxID=1541197 RepID=UPI00052FDCD9|nr:hypothetical protein [Planococcus sp. CAU13]
MFARGFPNHLQDDVTRVVRLLSKRTFFNVAIKESETTVQYSQNNQVINFPYRIYPLDNSNGFIDRLSEQQKMILHCILSRSDDGYIRQKHLRALLQMDCEDWAIPYIVKICDEYVVEILEMSYDFLKEQDTARIKNFCSENREAFCKSYSRMISYWNEYYRHTYSDFHQYVGRKLFRECFGYTRAMELKSK